MPGGFTHFGIVKSERHGQTSKKNNDKVQDMTKRLTIIFAFLMTGCTCFSLPVDQSQLIYHVECRTNLTSGAWENYTSITGTHSEILWNISFNAETNRAFFRVTAEEE